MKVSRRKFIDIFKNSYLLMGVGSLFGFRSEMNKVKDQRIQQSKKRLAYETNFNPVPVGSYSADRLLFLESLNQFLLIKEKKIRARATLLNEIYKKIEKTDDANTSLTYCEIELEIEYLGGAEYTKIYGQTILIIDNDWDSQLPHSTNWCSLMRDLWNHLVVNDIEKIYQVSDIWFCLKFAENSFIHPQLNSHKNAKK